MSIIKKLLTPFHFLLNPLSSMIKLSRHLQVYESMHFTKVDSFNEKFQIFTAKLNKWVLSRYYNMLLSWGLPMKTVFIALLVYGLYSLIFSPMALSVDHIKLLFDTVIQGIRDVSDAICGFFLPLKSQISVLVKDIETIHQNANIVEQLQKASQHNTVLQKAVFVLEEKLKLAEINRPTNWSSIREIFYNIGQFFNTLLKYSASLTDDCLKATSGFLEFVIEKAPGVLNFLFKLVLTAGFVALFAGIAYLGFRFLALFQLADVEKMNHYAKLCEQLLDSLFHFWRHVPGFRGASSAENHGVPHLLDRRALDNLSELVLRTVPQQLRNQAFLAYRFDETEKLLFFMTSAITALSIAFTHKDLMALKDHLMTFSNISTQMSEQIRTIPTNVGVGQQAYEVINTIKESLNSALNLVHAVNDSIEHTRSSIGEHQTIQNELRRDMEQFAASLGAQTNDFRHFLAGIEAEWLENYANRAAADSAAHAQAVAETVPPVAENALVTPENRLTGGQPGVTSNNTANTPAEATSGAPQEGQAQAGTPEFRGGPAGRVRDFSNRETHLGNMLASYAKK